MKSEYINVDGKWGVVFCHDLHMIDEYEMRQSMMSFGMRGRQIEDAIEILLYKENTGMCVSRDDIRMSLIFVGNGTSKEQYWDTVVHELYHAASSIIDYYGISDNEEDFAWTIGFLMRKAVELTSEPCH
ncbi:MAG: hypothetical protein K6D91_05945 [Prevotella sp.]|nr:hypothetical protein [Prevotella sp.]